MTCPQCAMPLAKRGGVEGAPKKEAPPAPTPEVFYQCPMHPEIVADRPGKCPKCQMDLVKRERKPEPPPEVFYMCPHHPEVQSDKPGTCPKCGMALERHEKKRDAAPPPPPGAARTVYVCPMHKEEAFDAPGKCFKGACAGMDLEALTLSPDARLVYACPDHPDVQSDKPGACPKDGKPLQWKVASDATRVVDCWMCPMHPEHKAEAKGPCPVCATEMKHVEHEQILAVPFSAVIDTGMRRVVFVEWMTDTFDMVEIVVGPRAGEYYPVIKGLAAGQRVVTAGAFLLDAEARLNPAASAQYFGASGHEGHK